MAIPNELVFNPEYGVWQSEGTHNIFTASNQVLTVLFRDDSYTLVQVGKYLYGGKTDSNIIRRIRRPNDSLVKHLISRLDWLLV